MSGQHAVDLGGRITVVALTQEVFFMRARRHLGRRVRRQLQRRYRLLVSKSVGQFLCVKHFFSIPSTWNTVYFYKVHNNQDASCEKL